MKASVFEYDTQFEIQLVAETLEDAALLSRFGLNATKRPAAIFVHAQETIRGSVYLQKPVKQKDQIK